MNLSTAIQQADEILRTLSPFCHRIEIAGSVRRQKPDGIKDIEICLIPRADSLFHLAVAINSKWGLPAAGKWPAKYTKIRGLADIDIFTATVENWGLLFWIRTGPADYVRNGLARWKTVSKGGYSEGAQLHDAQGSVILTPEEKDVFAALRWPWVQPLDRK